MAFHLHVQDEPRLAEREPLLQQSGVDDAPQPSPNAVSPHIAPKLYLSHFLSTWNSRVFEFGAVLYLATLFPGTLLPMSVYAFTRGLSAILFAPAVGQYIDTGNRLQVLRVSIVVQRLAVAASCVIFYILTIHLSLGRGGIRGILTLLAFLACLEKLGSIMNQVSVERDWVVVVTRRNEAALRTMNAQMRRIDLLCKVVGPLLIALIVGFSTKVAIVTNFTMNIASVGVEYFAIARVYHDIPELQEPKQHKSIHQGDLGSLQESESWFTYSCRHVGRIVTKTSRDFSLYFHHQAFLPSIASTFLALTVLTFEGQMVTYLLSTGFNTTQVGIARTLSVAFEVLATWISPWLTARIGPARAGLWLSSWQLIMLVAGAAVFWAFLDKPMLSASGLVGGTILSRLGLIGFWLCIQLIIQEDVEEENRGAFSSVEAVWQNLFELLSYATTMIFSRPEQFKWPTLISVVAIASANSTYSAWVGLRRRHLAKGVVIEEIASDRDV